MRGEFDQSKYVYQFTKATYKRLYLLLHKEKDSDIIEHLDKKKHDGESLSGYLKRLIRNDIK